MFDVMKKCNICNISATFTKSKSKKYGLHRRYEKRTNNYASRITANKHFKVYIRILYTGLTKYLLKYSL